MGWPIPLEQGRCEGSEGGGLSRPPKAVREYMAKLGKKGGETKGKTKARDPEKMRAAAKKRWQKKRSDNQSEK